MLDRFGLSRVIEPKGAMTVTAWRVDNSREISQWEARVRISLVHVERDNFQQVCNECGFDEEAIIAKFQDIIHKRGKLHNPFTDSGGIFCGTIEEMGMEYKRSHPDYRAGDEVLCNCSLTSIPLHIERIEKIDYNYGELTVAGHAILFETSPIFLLPGGLALNYTMATLDEAGSVYMINTMARPGMRVLVIGKDLISLLLYSGTIRKAIGRNGYVMGVLDDENAGSISGEETAKILNKYLDVVYLPDLTDPVGAYDEIMKTQTQLADLTVNCEDLAGAEVLGVLMTKEKGQLYFASLRNSYGKAVLVAESMGKEIATYTHDQYYEGYIEFTVELLRDMREDLDEVNLLYQKYSSQRKQLNKILDAMRRNKANHIGDFVFRSPKTKTMVDEVLNIAGYDCSVIIQGETGVGKEKVLELIHKNSARKANPCVKINCATIQETLAESEFFGYEPGAFTGAQTAGKKGYFELANNGILFLDEIGQLSQSLQSKLLRVLQENTFYRLGGTRQLQVNVRVICANNISLRSLVEEGKFREDLYYRLNICKIEVPPLRERVEDIACLSETFLKKYCQRYGIFKEVSLDGFARLSNYHWPGNVRELDNLIHRVVINTRGEMITGEDVDRVINESVYDDLILDLRDELQQASGLDFNVIIENQERKLVEYALKKTGTTRKAAEYLSMTQAQLMRKKQKYEL